MNDPQTTDLPAELRRLAEGNVGPLAGAAMEKAADEIERLRKALVPFANAARTRVVQDALSFGRDAPKLGLSRGFGMTQLDPWDFAEALKLT